MVRCYICKLILNDNRSFIRHVQLYHSLSASFYCDEVDCDRAFDLLDSFIRHRQKKHNDLHKDSVQSNLFQILSNDIGNLEVPADPDSDAGICSDIQNNFDDSSDSDASSELDFPFHTDDSHLGAQAILSTSTNAVHERMIKFAANLYHSPDMSRKRVDGVITDAAQLFESSLVSLRQEVRSRLHELGANEVYCSEIENVFENFAKPFEGITTEKQRFAQFRRYETFVVPESYVIGERPEYKIETLASNLKYTPVVAQFVPIRRVLKQFFEMPGVLDQTLDYVKSVNSQKIIVSNIIQSPFWKQKLTHYGDKTVFPLLMYFDDYENNNPLGSHKGISKCGAVYLSIPCLPPNFQSKIENIFLFILFNTLDRSVFKNAVIFNKVVDELKFLQSEGITVNHASGKKQIYFDLALILGDNLGLHSIFGLVESFRAKKFCRFCFIDNSRINQIYNEKDCVLRTIENYLSSLELNNVQLTGIKEGCIFNDIPGFHIMENYAVDVMHDILEGVCRYDIALLLHYFIYVRKFFTLTELNEKIRAFNYGSNSNINKPPQILESHMKNKHIVLSSAEMLNLVRNLNMIIGLAVDENDEHWQLLLLLKDILNIVCSAAITIETPTLLQLKIEEYLTLLNKKFPNSIKPKHHFLLHYPRIMSLVGPLWQITCMRYESKHREGKRISHSAVSRVNICRTIALRHQLILNYRLLCKHSTYPIYISGAHVTNSIKNLCDVLSFIHLLPPEINDNVTMTGWIHYNGNKIKNNSVVVIFSELGPQFHLVHSIILISGDDFLIVTKSMTDCYFNEHTRAYKIYDLNHFHWESLTKGDLNSAVISYVNKLSDGMYYISKNWV